MCLTQRRLVLVLVLTLAASQPAWTAPPAEQKPPAEAKKPVGLDRYGDPLPEGAVARAGTVRLRHRHHTSALAFFPDGKTLATGGSRIRLWDLATGKEIRHFEARNGYVYALAISPDGKTVASVGTTPTGGSDKVIRLWDPATGNELPPLEGHQDLVTSLAFSPDVKTLASRSDDQTVRLWDVYTRKEVRHCEAHRRRVLSVAFAFDGKTIASAAEDGIIYWWDAATGKEVHRFTRPPHEIVSVAFSPDCKLLALGCRDQTLRLVETSTERELRRVKVGRGYSLLAFSPDGKTLASSDYDGMVSLCDVAAGQVTRRWASDVRGSLRFSPDGKVLAGAGMNGVRLWEAATGKPVLPFEGHGSGVTALAFGPQGRELVAGDRGGSIRVWEPATGRALRVLGKTPGSQSGIALSPDGKILALASGPRLLDTVTGKDLPQFPALNGSSESVALSADGAILAGAWKDAIHFWDVRTGKEVRQLPKDQSVSRAALAFSPDGGLLAVLKHGGFRPWTRITLWSTATGEELRHWEGNLDLFSPTFSPDGKTLATGSDDGTVRLWAVATGQEVRRLGTQSRSSYQTSVPAVAYSPSGRTLATGKTDGTVHLWELATGKEVCQFAGHESGINVVAFAPDGRILASGSDDATILIWDAAGPGRQNLSRPIALTVAELQDLWITLGELDAPTAHQALWRLVAAPGQATTFLRQRLPAALKGAQRLEQLINSLDHADLAVRQQAFEELVKLGPSAGPALQAAIAGQPSEEVRSQAKRLLANVRGPSARTSSTFRVVRGIEALELIGTAGAERVLKDLAKADPEARLTQEAKAALDRLAKRPQ